MKKIILLAFFALFSGHLFGQAELGVLKSEVKTTDTLGRNTEVTLWVQNVGNQTYTDSIWGNVRTPKKEHLKVSKIFANLNPGDSIHMVVPVPVNNENFSLGDNIIVVWPTGTTIKTRDTVRKIITVVASGIFESNHVDRLSVYPNPFSDNLQIACKGSEYRIKSILLTGISGSQDLLQVTDNRISMPALSSGVYFLSFRFSDGQEQVFKLIKE
jgi:hypothetical protein